MSEYVLTPNLGLFKPNWDGDEDEWGNHTNANWDTLDTVLAHGAGITVSGSPPALTNGAMWFDSVSTQLYIGYDDGNSLQWVIANNDGGGGLGTYLPLTGGTVTGATTFSGAGTGLAVTNNATVGGTLMVTSTITSVGTSFMQAGNNVGANNIIRFNPAAAGATPSLQVLGPDANIDLQISLTGAGALKLPRIEGNTNIALSGTFATRQSPAWFATSVSGTATDSSARPVYYQTINSDSVDYRGSQGLAGWSLAHNMTGYKGGRFGLMTALNQTGAGIGSVSANNFYEAAHHSVTMAFQEPGSTAPTAAGSRGQPFAMALYATLAPGAKNYTGVAGMEVDIIAAEQPFAMTGIQVVRLTGGYGSQYQAAERSLDIAYKVGGVGGAAAWVNGFVVGTTSTTWPLDTTDGRILMAYPPQNYSLGSARAGWGVDFSYVQFNNYAWKSWGAAIDGVGAASFQGLNIANWSATPSATGLSIDAPRQVALTVASIGAGGSGYNVNEQFSFATNGRGRVTSVSGGVVTGVTIIDWPTAISPPANPVATTSLQFANAGQASGSGLTLNLTWSVANTLALQTSGGATTFGGPVTLPTGSTGPWLLLVGGTVTGATTFSAVGTALSVTNNATIGGVATVGSGANNILTITPGAASTNTVALNVSGTGAIAVNTGLDFGSTVAVGPNSLVRHLNLYGGQYGMSVTSGRLNHVVASGSGAHVFMAGSTDLASISPTLGIVVGATGAPTIRSGTGAATGTQPKGSLWMRTDGAVGSTLYVSQGGGTWNAVAGV